MEKTIAKKYVLASLIAVLNGETPMVTNDKGETITVTTADMVAYAQHELELLAKKSAKKSDKKISQETINRMNLVYDTMVELFADGDKESLTPSDILATGKFAPGTSTQLMRSTLVLLMNDGRVDEIKRQGKSSVWKLAD